MAVLAGVLAVLAGVLAVLAEESQAFFKYSQHINSISNSAILRNNYILLLSDLCACIHGKKKWHCKGSHSSSVSSSNRLVWLQIWKKAMDWCTAKTIVKESHKFELARLKKKKKKKKEKHFGHLATFWFSTFAMLFSATGCVVHHENTRKWTVRCYNGLYYVSFGDFEKFVCISIYCVSALSLHIESTDSMIAPSVHKIQRSRSYSVYQVIKSNCPVTLLFMCCAVTLFSDTSQHTHSWLTLTHLWLLLHTSTGLDKKMKNSVMPFLAGSMQWCPSILWSR